MIWDKEYSLHLLPGGDFPDIIRYEPIAFFEFTACSEIHIAWEDGEFAVRASFWNRSGACDIYTRWLHNNLLHSLDKPSVKCFRMVDLKKAHRICVSDDPAILDFPNCDEAEWYIEGRNIPAFELTSESITRRIREHPAFAHAYMRIGAHHNLLDEDAQKAIDLTTHL